VAIWTAGLFLLASALGLHLLNYVERWRSGVWAVGLAAVAFVLTIRLMGRLAQTSFRRRIHAAFGRWARWEFWPAWLFYAPVALNYAPGAPCCAALLPPITLPLCR
jgi:hypothetical protein